MSKGRRFEPSLQGKVSFFTAAGLFAKFAAEEAGLWGEATKLREARAKTNTAPTPTQRKSGRYAKGRFVWNGLKIAIENPLGSVREGKSKDGTSWRRRMTCDYGHFEDYKGFDGDELDVLIGPDLTSEAVFVVDQKNAEGDFDESKVVIGTADIVEARDLYLANYQDCWELNIRNIFPMRLDDFKAWLESGQALTDRGIQLAANFAGKKPLETPHPNRTDGHWITENGAHVFVDKSGKKFLPGQHPQDKTHRNVTVPVHPKLFTRLSINPAEVKADYVKLDQKHQDQFMGADDARQHVEHVMAAPTHVLPGGSDHSSEPGHVLLVRKNGGDKAAVLDMVISGAKPDTKNPGKMFGGRYNIRSAYTLNPARLALKIANAPSGWSADFSVEAEALELRQEEGTRWRIGPSSPASKTLREEELHPTIRRQLCLGPTVPLDTDSTGSSIISLPFVAFSLYARFLKEQDGKLAIEADFFADFSTADFTAGTFVNVPALLSRTGNYTDKGIHLTAADFDRAVKSVSPSSPVKMNMAHLRRGSVLDDAGLGEIHRTWRQGQELWGEIAVPQWLASLARERGLKLPVSAEWDIKTKTLRGCAWERTPRIEDARALLS